MQEYLYSSSTIQENPSNIVTPNTNVNTLELYLKNCYKFDNA